MTARKITQQKKTSELVSFIDVMASVVLFVLLVLYSAFTSNFSELSILIPGLSFPIFIGEIALGFLLCLAALKCYLLRFPLSRGGKFVIAITAFILLKALYGYQHWNALAFRNAAMFYYFLYAVLAYFFYCPVRFDRDSFKILCWLFFIFLVTFWVRFGCEGAFAYFLYGYLMWIIITILQFKKNAVLKLLLAAVTIFLFPVSVLFNETRGLLVAVVVALLFLFGILSFILSPNKMKRTLFILPALFILVVVAFSFMSSDAKNRMSTLVNAPQLFHEFQVKKAQVDRALPGFVPLDFDIKLYESNRPRVDTKIDISKPNYDLMIENFSGNPVESRQALAQQKKYIGDKILQNFGFTDTSSQNERQRSQFNLIWRLLLWSDMCDDIRSIMLTNPVRLLFGIDFGYPIRSKRLEATDVVFPIQTGWLEPHNAFLHVVYRSGLIGLFFIGIMVWLFVKMIKIVLQDRSVVGALMLSSLVYWVVFSMSLVIMELPHYAIPFWCQAGLAYAYIFKKGKGL